MVDQKMNVDFIKLREEDFPFLQEIYNFYILNSTATFHIEPVSIEILKEMIPVNHAMYKSYLLKADNKACGYAYLGRYKNRAAYNRTAEVTVYLKPEYIGKGFGKAALKRLEQDAIGTGIIKVLIGVISAENTNSIELFKKTGYVRCAYFKEVGEKFGRILDVVAYQKMI
jgi:phosphinothricin acetyltransferase